MTKNDTIAAVVPVFNPEPGLRALCASLVEAYGLVLVVDDGSVENTEDFFALPTGVRLVRHETNRGKGRAIKTAIEWLQEHAPAIETAVFVDGDGQHRPEDVAKVVAKSQETGNVVLGVRDFSKQNVPFRSRFGNIMTSFLVRLMYRIPIFDTQTGLRAIPRRLFDLMLQTSGERYEYEMRLFGMLDGEHETLEQVSIETIYLENNRASHFHPIRDSFRVYQGLFGGSPAKFVLTSILGFVVDIAAFSLLLWILRRVSPLNLATAILLAHGVARLLSATVNYQCNRRLVFESKAKPVVSFGKYFALAIVIWTLSYASTTVLALTFNAGGGLITFLKVISDVVLFILSYQIQKGWVFGKRRVMSIPFVRRSWYLIQPVFLFFILLLVDTIIGLYVDHEPVTWKSWAMICAVTLQSLFLVMSVPLLFRRDSRFVMPGLFILMAVFEAMDLTAFLRFRITVRGEIFAIAMGSSRDEMLSFMASFATWSNILLALSFLIFIVWGCRRLWRRPGIFPRNRLWSYVLGVILLVISVVSRPPTRVLFVDFVVDSVRQFGRYHNLAKAVREPELSDVEPAPEKGPVPVIVFLIGESSSRDHWQLYGYERETTPRISARAARGELFVFDDVLASWAHTQEALYMLLTRATLDKPNEVVATLPQVLSEGGYHCSLLSTQAHWGIFDSVDALLFTGCEDRLYVEELKPPVEGFDERVLPFVEQALVEPEDGRPQALFIHLYGNHYPFRYRYPDEAIHFSKDETPEQRGRSAASYDDSIRYTDGILDRIIGFVEATGREAVLIHLSDHGETPDSPSNRMLTDPALWRIPFFVWCSPAYRASHPDQVAALARVKGMPLQADRLYDGFLDLANVSLKNRETKSFLSEDFDWTVPRKVENGKKEVGPNYGVAEPPVEDPEGNGGNDE